MIPIIGRLATISSGSTKKKHVGEMASTEDHQTNAQIIGPTGIGVCIYTMLQSLGTVVRSSSVAMLQVGEYGRKVVDESSNLL